MNQSNVSKNFKNELPGMTFKQFMRRMFGIYKPFKWAAITLFVLLLVGEGLSLVSPYIYGKIIDGIIAEKDMVAIAYLVFIAFGVYVLNGVVLNFIRERIEIEKLDHDVNRLISRKTLEKVLDFSIGQHENQNSGIKKSIIDKGEHSLSSFAFTMIYDAIPSVLQIIVAIVALSFLAPILGLIVFIGVVLVLLTSIYINKISHDDVKKIDDMRHDNSKKHNEILRNISLVKINAKEQEMVAEYDLDIEKTDKFAKKFWNKFILFTSTRNFVSYLARFSVMFVGVYLVYQKSYTPGSLVIFWSWSNNAFSDLGHLARLHRRIIEMYTAIKKYFALVDIDADIKEAENPIVLDRINGSIKFENIYFAYPQREYVDDSEEEASDGKESAKKEDYVLKDVDIYIKAGEKVAIVGPSGAGKSTLVQLLVRAYDPDKGQVLIDGKNLKDLSLKNFRSSLSIVPQDISLFDNTLKYNILFGVTANDVTDEDLQKVAKVACLDKFISNLEKGFDTIVGERGVKLSGGERQRVGIARALIKNPAILIFDEATSSLDTENEALIQESIERASKGRTTIIIAHRLSTIKNADKIIVVENGKIVGEGKHEELLRACETYQRLINNQTVVVVE